jgi:ribonuclease-3
MRLWEAAKSVFGRLKKNADENLRQDFQSRINYRFKNGDLLRVALTHRSYAKLGEKDWLPSNERLEFLGDSVLGLIVSEFLFSQYPDKLEGGLTRLKSLLVNETTLFRTAEAIGLGDYVLLSQEEDRSGGRKRPSIIADAMEALIGAMYLDGGLAAIKPLVYRHIISQVNTIIADDSFRNYKGELLELLQGKAAGMPRYDVVSETGPDHDKTFIVTVSCNGENIGCGSGASKKDAEQKAAAEALKKLQTG